MNKKILATIICAVVVVAGAFAATTIVRKNHQAVQPVDDPIATTELATVALDEAFGAEEGETTTLLDTIATAANNVAGTIKNTANKKNNATTKAADTNKKSSSSDSDETEVDRSNTIADYAGVVNRAMEDAAVFGFSYDSSGDYYYCNDKDNWQKYTGYNHMYDKLSSTLAIIIDTFTVDFEYGSLEWRIQFWKGMYGLALIGAEIGVYTRTPGANTGGNVGDHYNCATDNMLKMTMSVYFQQEKGGTYNYMFSRPYTEYWWCTGMVPGTVSHTSHPFTEIRVKAQITFRSPEMAELFKNGLAGKGFRRASSASALATDSYFQDGSNVYVLWARAPY